MTTFQSTHPRRVRQIVVKVKVCAMEISIHAPAKGATFRSCGLVSMIYFNPRTREGCDAGNSPTLLNFNNFNPRTREGCDRTHLTY